MNNIKTFLNSERSEHFLKQNNLLKTSFVCVDKDLWQLQLVILLNAFSKVVIKIHKLTSLEYEPVLCVLTKNFDSYNCFF